MMEAVVSKPTEEEAFAQGVAASRIEGPDSLLVFNPYDDEAEPELYDAWDDGFFLDEDTKGEIAHRGL